MAEVIKLNGSDWRRKDVSQDKRGWDITFTHKTSSEVARVEVKGVSGTKSVVPLTANEVRAAESQVGWRLAVVTGALTSPKVTGYTADEALDAAKPYVYRADMATK